MGWIYAAKCTYLYFICTCDPDILYFFSQCRYIQNKSNAVFAFLWTISSCLYEIQIRLKEWVTLLKCVVSIGVTIHFLLSQVSSTFYNSFPIKIIETFILFYFLWNCGYPLQCVTPWVAIGHLALRWSASPALDELLLLHLEHLLLFFLHWSWYLQGCFTLHFLNPISQLLLQSRFFLS